MPSARRIELLARGCLGSPAARAGAEPATRAMPGTAGGHASEAEAAGAFHTAHRLHAEDGDTARTEIRRDAVRAAETADGP